MKEIFTRRSVRFFDLTKKLSEKELIRICEAGFMGPTAKRQKSAYFIIVDDEELIEKLAKVSPGSMNLTNCNTLIALIGEDPKLLKNPVMQIQDLSAAQENMAIEARYLGYGSCWIGVTPLEDRMIPAKELLGVPDDLFVFSLLAVGYPLKDDAFFEADKIEASKIRRNRF